MNLAIPRYATPLNEDAPSYYPLIEAKAIEMGTPLMPWQQYAGKLLGELTEEGNVKYRRILLTVPRQSGKTTLSKVALAARAEFAPNQELYTTSKTKAHAEKAHLGKLALAQPELKYYRARGDKSLTWSNGSTLQCFPNGESGGHGDSVDFCLWDELWLGKLEAMAGISPAMSARPNAQMLMISTAGTDESELFNTQKKRGRESVDDPDSLMAYVEFAAPNETACFDSLQWETWMPALGITIEPWIIHDEMENLEPYDFIRSYGNLNVASLSIVFPEEWILRAYRPIPPMPIKHLAIDINEEPIGACITAGYETDQGIATRVVEWQYGSPTWLISALDALAAQHEIETLWVDLGGPARMMKGDLETWAEDNYVTLVNPTWSDMGGYFASFYDALRNQNVYMEKSEQLDQSLRGSVKKNLGDLWVVHRRKMKVDASLTVATVLAHAAIKEAQNAPSLVYVG